MRHHIRRGTAFAAPPVSRTIPSDVFLPAKLVSRRPVRRIRIRALRSCSPRRGPRTTFMRPSRIVNSGSFSAQSRNGVPSCDGAWIRRGVKNRSFPAADSEQRVPLSFDISGRRSLISVRRCRTHRAWRSCLSSRRSSVFRTSRADTERSMAASNGSSAVCVAHRHGDGTSYRWRPLPGCHRRVFRICSIARSALPRRNSLSRHALNWRNHFSCRRKDPYRRSPPPPDFMTRSISHRASEASSAAALRNSAEGADGANAHDHLTDEALNEFGRRRAVLTRQRDRRIVPISEHQDTIGL